VVITLWGCNDIVSVIGEFIMGTVLNIKDMGNFKGTKGKWVHMEFPEGQNSVRNLDGSRKICVPRVHNREESNANMLLISKAPEMLEMLEWLVDSKLLYTTRAELEIIKLIKEATEL